jgi:putative Holliday junction resolvase
LALLMARREEQAKGRGEVHVRIAMGLDVGTKTIGVALSDGLALLAHPVLTIEREGVRRDCEALARVVTERKVGVVVVGLPLELDGSEERSARLARQVGERMAEVTGLPVHYADERFSSVDAERRLIAAGRSRAQRKERIDQAAAALILQSWMEEGGRASLSAGQPGGAASGLASGPPSGLASGLAVAPSSREGA